MSNEINKIMMRTRKINILSTAYYITLGVIPIVASLVSEHRYVEVLMAGVIYIGMWTLSYPYDETSELKVYKVNSKEKASILKGIERQTCLSTSITKAFILSLTIILLIALDNVVSLMIKHKAFPMSVSALMLLVTSIVFFTLNWKKITETDLIVNEETEREKYTEDIKFTDEILGILHSTRERIKDTPSLSEAEQSISQLTKAIEQASFIMDEKSRMEIFVSIRELLDIEHSRIVNASKLVMNDVGIDVLNDEAGNKKLVNIYRPIGTDIKNLVELALTIERELITSAQDKIVSSALSSELNLDPSFSPYSPTAIEKWNSARRILAHLPARIDDKVNIAALRIAVTKARVALDDREMDANAYQFIIDSEEGILYLSKVLEMPNKTFTRFADGERLVELTLFATSICSTLEKIDDKTRAQREQEKRMRAREEANNLYDFL